MNNKKATHVLIHYDDGSIIEAVNENAEAVVEKAELERFFLLREPD